MLFFPFLTIMLFLTNTAYTAPTEISADVGPYNLTQIHELAARSPLEHQDPLNITDVELYKSVYKRDVACDPIGCFDTAYFSFIVSWVNPQAATVYGAGQDPVEFWFWCSTAWGQFDSWLPWVFEIRWYYSSAWGNCIQDPMAFSVRYASITDDNLNTGVYLDTRCGVNGGGPNLNNLRCIFPIHP